MVHPRKSMLMMFAAVTLAVSVGGCDKSPPEDPSDEESAETRPDGESSDAETADRAPDADRLWLGRFAEHDKRVRIDLAELDGGGGLRGGVAFDSGGSAPFNAELLTEPYRDLQKVDVLTTEGTVRLALDRIARDQVGSDSFVLRLLTEPSDGLADRLEEWTLVAPAGEFADGATLEHVDGQPAHAKAVPKIRDAVMGKLTSEQREKYRTTYPPPDIEPEQRKRLEAGEPVDEVVDVDRSLSSEHMTSVTGNFPSPRSQVVAVNGPTVIGGVQGQEFPIVRALLFATQTGKVTETVDVMFGPSHAHGHAATARAQVLALADPDGDGTDGVLYRADDDVEWVDVRDGESVHP